MPNRRRRLSDSRSVAGPASSSWNACADHGNANQGTPDPVALSVCAGCLDGTRTCVPSLGHA